MKNLKWRKYSKWCSDIYVAYRATDKTHEYRKVNDIIQKRKLNTKQWTLVGTTMLDLLMENK